jgi:hypothetical protein
MSTEQDIEVYEESNDTLTVEREGKPKLILQALIRYASDLGWHINVKGRLVAIEEVRPNEFILRLRRNDP